MSSVWAMWHTQYLSAIGGLRRDTRARMTWVIGLFVDIVAGFWAFHALSDNLVQWQEAGQMVLLSRLWLLCLYTWAGISLFAFLAVISQGFGNDTARLLMSMPVSAAARWRAQYSLVLFTGVGNWVLLANLVTAISLIVRLSWQAVPWLLLLDLGVAAAVCISMIVTWLVIGFALPNIGRVLIILALALVGIEAIVWVCKALNITVQIMLLPVSLLPALACILCIVLLAILIGPLASAAGKLYQNAFYITEGRSAARSALKVPMMGILSAWLSHYRTLAGALFYKGLINQSRNVFTWGRAAILVISVALFPLLQGVMKSYGFSPVAQVAVYSSIVAILAVVEYAAYAISSEGARISYYILAPLHIAIYLRARLIVFLGSILAIGLAVCMFLAWEARLSFYETGMAVTFMMLLLVGYTVLIVWGSAFDLDINQLSEGATQNLILEELPTTPRRLQLLGGSMLLLVSMIWLIVKLPAGLSIVVLVLLDGLALVALWRCSMVHLRRLVGGDGN